MKDVFLCHASCDKETFVRPFAKELELVGISYWLDEAEIDFGHGIAKAINNGLRDSRYTVVFLSSSFSGRPWADRELFAILHRDIAEKSNRLLPLILGNPHELLKSYPFIRDIKYMLWSAGEKALALDLAAFLKSETTKIEKLVKSCFQHYFDCVTRRDIHEAYKCFSTVFQESTPFPAYTVRFEHTLQTDLSEFRLINTIGDLTVCYLTIIAVGRDGNRETWRGTAEAIFEEDRWVIHTIRGLKHYPEPTDPPARPPLGRNTFRF